MSNKRKRRRQRQRAAIKQEQAVTWSNYKVAARVASRGGPVLVLNVKEYDEDKLFPLIMHYMNVKSVDEFDILDIHRQRDDGKVEVIAEISDSWPRGIAVVTIKGELMRGAGDEPFVLGAKSKPHPSPAPTATTATKVAVVGTRVAFDNIKPVLASTKATSV